MRKFARRVLFWIRPTNFIPRFFRWLWKIPESVWRAELQRSQNRIAEINKYLREDITAREYEAEREIYQETLNDVDALGEVADEIEQENPHRGSTLRSLFEELGEVGEAEELLQAKLQTRCKFCGQFCEHRKD